MNELNNEIVSAVTDSIATIAGDGLCQTMALGSIPTVLLKTAINIFQVWGKESFLAAEFKIRKLAKSCVDASDIPDNAKPSIKEQLVEVLNSVSLDAQKLVDDPGYIPELSEKISGDHFGDGTEKEEFLRALTLSLCVLSMDVRNTPEYQQAVEVLRQRIEHSQQNSYSRRACCQRLQVSSTIRWHTVEISEQFVFTCTPPQRITT